MVGVGWARAGGWVRVYWCWWLGYGGLGLVVRLGCTGGGGWVRVGCGWWLG